MKQDFYSSKDLQHLYYVFLDLIKDLMLFHRKPHIKALIFLISF